MFRFEIRGCLPFLFLFFVLFIFFKLWYLIVLLVFAAIAVSIISQFKSYIQLKKKEKEQSYEPQKGEVYKICSYCGAKVKRSSETCPQCGNSLN